MTGVQTCALPICGGRPVINDPARRIFMGGGGGSGAQNNKSGGAGGNAGGMIFIIAKNVSGSGVLRSNGTPGQNTQFENRDGAGGGGAGGTIVIFAEKLGGISAQARGGKGGDQSGMLSPNESESQGPGGGGGGGYIALKGGRVITDVSGGVNGVTGAMALAEFPPNGATSGATGQVAQATEIPFCQTTADLSVTITNDANYIVPGESTTYTILVKNNGPNSLYGIDVIDTLPSGFVHRSKAWDCNATEGSTCAVGSSTGDIVTKVSLLNQGSATFTITAAMDPSATGIAANTVRVLPPPGGNDPDMSNNTATDADPLDRKSTRLNSSHIPLSRMPSSA